VHVLCHTFSSLVADVPFWAVEVPWPQFDRSRVGRPRIQSDVLVRTSNWMMGCTCHEAMDEETLDESMCPAYKPGMISVAIDCSASDDIMCSDVL
jgi:hypothetical protein